MPSMVFSPILLPSFAWYTKFAIPANMWDGKNRHAIQSWQTNWENLTSYFDFPLEIRKIIYTTNSIENLNRGIRKYTKTKVQFPDDQAAEKAVYLAIMNIEKKWSMTLQNWGLILHQFLTIFEDRCRLS